MAVTITPYGDVRHPFGLPMGTVRGFMSVLICSFFWIFLLLPDDKAQTAPLAHFFLLTLVFLAFVSHPMPADRQRSEFLPWIMRVLFVGGSAAIVVYAAINFPDRLAARLTPAPADVVQWPVLLGTLAGGFGFGLFIRFVLGRGSDLFQTLRAWIGVIAIFLLLAETIYQFAIKPTLGDPPGPEAVKVWESIIIAFVASYFGTRA